MKIYRLVEFVIVCVGVVELVIFDWFKSVIDNLLLVFWNDKFRLKFIMFVLKYIMNNINKDKMKVCVRKIKGLIDFYIVVKGEECFWLLFWEYLIEIENIIKKINFFCLSV